MERTVEEIIERLSEEGFEQGSEIGVKDDYYLYEMYKGEETRFILANEQTGMAIAVFEGFQNMPFGEWQDYEIFDQEGFIYLFFDLVGLI